MKVSSATLLIGDPFLTEEKRKSLLDTIKKSAKGEVSIVSYSLSEVKLEQVLEECRTLPFMIAAQVFVLKQAHQIKEKQQEMLANYLKSPGSGAYLIFESDQSEKTTKFGKLIAKHGELIQLDDKGKKTATSRFIQEKLRAHGKTMAPGALRRLDEQVGGMPAFLDSILNQIISYSGNEKIISEDVVEKFEENWQEVDVFSLMNALASKNTAESLKLLEQILDDSGGDVYALMGLLHWQVRRLWLARFYMEQGMPQSMAFKRCKVYPKQATFFSRQLQNFSLPQLEVALEELFQLDWKIKTGRTEGPFGLEQWVVQTTT